MFCFQCQEAKDGTGCTTIGACGKKESTARLQDLLVQCLREIAVVYHEQKPKDPAIKSFITECLATTITNSNFDDIDLLKRILEAQSIRDKFCQTKLSWRVEGMESALEVAAGFSVMSESNEDIRSLRELVMYGLKGLSAYVFPARSLGNEDPEVDDFILHALAASARKMTKDDWINLAMATGEHAVKAMALLDHAHTAAFGHPEISEVDIGVGHRPGILISGHDLLEMKQLLEQTENQGIDVYTHSEMLSSHYYPELKKYPHLKGNYGNAWWKQNREFSDFNGPIVMTTNCIIPIKGSYRERIFTTGVVSYPGVRKIPSLNGKKDYSAVIELAKSCQPPKEIETGRILGGFAHNQVLALAPKIIKSVQEGKIKRFLVLAGCDGRQRQRHYFSEIAEKMPDDFVILTAGCAKYRYNKMDLGDIDGIPRILDAGQCNDSYSLAVIALALKEAFALEDINDLPITFNLGWYEQKAVAVLLGLLHLGVKNIKLGPTLPAFLSPGVTKILDEVFNLGGITDVDQDLAAIAAN